MQISLLQPLDAQAAQEEKELPCLRLIWSSRDRYCESVHQTQISLLQPLNKQAAQAPAVRWLNYGQLADGPTRWRQLADV